MKARKVKPKKFDTMVSLRLTTDELQAVHAKAAAAGMTVSSYIRSVAISPAALPFQVKCAGCGGLIIATDRPEVMGYAPLWMAVPPTDRTHFGCEVAA